MQCSIIFEWAGFINYACKLRHLNRLSRQSTFSLTAMGTPRQREREGREIQERIFMLIRRIIGWGRTEVLGLFSTSANKRLKPQTCCSYSTPFQSGFSTTKCNFAAFLGIFLYFCFCFIFYYLSYILPQFPWSLRKTLVAHFLLLFPVSRIYPLVYVCNFYLVNGSVNAHLACEVSTKTALGILMSVKA